VKMLDAMIVTMTASICLLLIFGTYDLMSSY